MTMRLYLLLSLVTCLSCKAQAKTVPDSIIVSPQVIVDSVSYEIIRDSVYCEKLESYYHYRVLNISHPNKAIENKINFQLLGLTDSMFDEKETLLYKSIISKHCNDLTMLFAFGTSDYQVEYNNNGLLSVLISFDDYDFYVTHKNYMNFDLLTGNKVELSDVFKVEPTSLISMINQQIVKELEFSRQLIIEREEFETISLLKNLDFFLKNKKKQYILQELPEFYLTEGSSPLEEKTGIEFRVNIWVFEPPLKNLNPRSDYFFTFNELKPYLTDSFKKQIGL